MACKSQLLWIILFLNVSVGRVAFGQKNKICEDTTCDLEDYLIKKFSDIDDAQNYFSGVKNEVRELNSSVTAELKVKETLEKQILDLEKNITSEANVRKIVEGNLTTLQEEVQNLRSSLILLSNNSKLDDFDKNLRSTKNMQKSLDNDLGKVNLQLSEINQTLSRSVLELNSSLHQLQSNADVTTSPTIHTDIKHLQTQIDEMDEDLKNNVARLNDESSVLNQRINDTIKTMQAQYQNFNQRMLEINQTSNDEINRLKQYKKSLASTQQDLINQIEYLNATLQQQISTTPTPDRQDTSCKLDVPTENGIVVTLNGQDVIRVSSQVKDGQSVTYECSEKKYRKLEGSSQRTCSSGLWNEVQPHCVDPSVTV